MTRRVVITSVGVVCSLGKDLEGSLEALRMGRSGIDRIRVAEGLEIAAGAVPDSWITEEGRQLDRTTRLALTAAAEALGASDEELDPRLGCVLGAGLGGVETAEEAYRKVYAEGATRLRPTSIPAAMYNAATSALAARYGAGGPAFSISSACASAAHAIGQAASWIRDGTIDRAICGGSDAPLYPGIVTGWRSMRVLAPPEPNPSRACRPFSRDREGLVLAEGAAVLVLEERTRALERGEEILGEIVGFGMSSDAGHITDPSLDGPVRAIRSALAWGPTNPDEIGYVNAHGTGTRANDQTEVEALREVFGERLREIPVSSTKSVHGHAMGAAGAVETALSLGASRQGWVPGTPTLIEADSALGEAWLPSEPVEPAGPVWLCNSFGFGGMNGVVLVRPAVGSASV